MIEGIGGPRPPQTGSRSVRTGGLFVEMASSPSATARAADVTSVALGGMLAMQEAEADAASDREARRDGEDMLRELAGLQRELLGEGVSEAGLARVAELASRARVASDKGLRGVLDAIGLRARVELARYETDA